MTNPKWEIGPVQLANGTEGHIDFVDDRGKSIAYTGRFKTYNGDWWAIHWDESGRVPNSCEGYGHNLAPPPKKTVRIKVCLLVYEDGSVVACGARDEAAQCEEEGRFAWVEIDRIVTKGEGL